MIIYQHIYAISSKQLTVEYHSQNSDFLRAFAPGPANLETVVSTLITHFIQSSAEQK